MIEIIDPVASESFEIFEVAGSCYVELEDNTCNSLTNNGSIEIDPNSYLYQHYIHLLLLLMSQPYDVIMDWGIDSDGNFENYIIPNLDAGTVYTITLMNGNGCYYDMENYQDNIVEVPILSELISKLLVFALNVKILIMEDLLTTYCQLAT